MTRTVYLIIGLVIAVLLAFLVIRGRILGIKTSAQTTIILTGDVMLGRTVMTTSLDKKDVSYPFAKVADKLASADIAFINLENPIVEGCPRHYSGFKFCSDPKMIEGLNFAGVDAVNLANNHTGNYGEKGLLESVEKLTQKGIKTTGVGNLAVIEKNGTKFGFLGFEESEKGSPALSAVEESLVKDSDKKVDVLIVAMHWGTEYKDKANIGQRTLAKKLVEWGADVVVGHHPHWVQDMEYINGPASSDGLQRASKPVYYSLGNFIFDQMWSEKTRQGLVIKLTFDGTKLVKEEKLQTYMKSHAQPEWIGFPVK